MKWMTHQAAAVGMALVLHLPVEGVLASCFGAVLPDMLDQRASRMTRNPQRTFNRIHRGVTHWCRCRRTGARSCWVWALAR